MFHWGMLLVTVPLLFEILFVGVLLGLLQQERIAGLRQSNAKSTVAAAESVNKAATDAAAAVAVYVMTRSRLQAQRIDRACLDLQKAVQTLEVMSVDNAAQAQRVLYIDVLSDELLQIVGTVKATVDEGGYGLQTLASGGFKRRLSDLSSALFGQVHAFSDAEAKLHPQSALAVQQSENQVKSWIFVGVMLNVAIAFGLAVYFSGEVIVRLNSLTDNAQRLPRGLPLNPPVEGQYEIAMLDSVFHHMADELQEARRKEMAMIDNAVDLICSIDSQGNFTKVNPAATSLLGWQPAELIGHPLLDLVVPEHRQMTSDNMRAVRLGKDRLSFENRMSKSDGTTSDVLWSMHWSADEQALFCVAHDISERKQMERLRQEFVAMVSHDLRTPLTAAQGSLEMLVEGVYGELPDKALTRILATEKDMVRLIKMINDLLDFERMEAGKLDLDYGDIDLPAIVDQAMDAIRGFAEINQVALENQTNPLKVVADGDRLVQVLVNLIANAVKFSPKGGAVSVSAEPDADFVVVKVQDQGRGVPESMRDSIFERFKQVEKTDATQKKGTGLGLPICKLIVEQHGGTIGVDSVAGEGSTFWFRLPSHPESTA